MTSAAQPRIRPRALPVLAALALGLAACSTTSPPAPTPSPTPTSSAAALPTPAGGSSPVERTESTASPSGTSEEYLSEPIVTGLTIGGEPLQVTDRAELAQYLDSMADQLNSGTMIVDPPECSAPLGAERTLGHEGGYLTADLTLALNRSGVQASASYREPGREQIFAETATIPDTCRSLSVTFGGETSHGSVRPISLEIPGADAAHGVLIGDANGTPTQANLFARKGDFILAAESPQSDSHPDVAALTELLTTLVERTS